MTTNSPTWTLRTTAPGGVPVELCGLARPTASALLSDLLRDRPLAPVAVDRHEAPLAA